jgi:hypothetical protein
VAAGAQSDLIWVHRLVIAEVPPNRAERKRLFARKLGLWRQRSVVGTADRGRRGSSPFASWPAGGLWPEPGRPVWPVLARASRASCLMGVQLGLWGSTQRQGHLGWFAGAAATVRELPGSSGRLSPCLPDDGAARRGFGVGGWCTWFHPRTETSSSAEGGRACKERLVREGKAHAALVFDGDLAVAWCQFGAVAGRARRDRSDRAAPGGAVAAVVSP